MDDKEAEPAAEPVQAPPAPEPEPTEQPPAHSDAADTAAAAEPASGTADEPRDVADHLETAADLSAWDAGEDEHTAASTSEFGLLLNRAPPDKGVCSVSPDDDAIWGVKGLSRAWSPGWFSIWHLDMPLHTTSEALAADRLGPAADYIERGDVIFITTRDGVLLRALSVRDDGKVFLAPVI